MALSAAAATGAGSQRGSTLGGNVEKGGAGGKWGDAPEYNSNYAMGQRGSMIKDPHYGEEERLDAELELARRNSRDQELMVRRAS